jgi:glycosyltransferase involved in cell wall biosynthesis
VIVVLSQRWRQWVYSVAPQARVRVIPNGVALPRLTPDGDRPPTGPCRFLFLALMDESKGLFDLLAAAAQLQSEASPFELTLAGPWASGRDQERFGELLRRYGLEDTVKYVGVAAPQRRADLLAEADVFVSPSHGEVMPMSILEAMSYALPIIGSDVGAVAETVGDGLAGLIIKPGDQEALAGAMRKLSRDPALRSRLGQEARRRVARSYSDAAQAETVLGLYRGLLPAGPVQLSPAGYWRGLSGRSTIKPTCRQVDTKL